MLGIRPCHPAKGQSTKQKANSCCIDKQRGDCEMKKQPNKRNKWTYEWNALRVLAGDSGDGLARRQDLLVMLNQLL